MLMTTRERICRLMDDLSEADLRTAERPLRGLTLVPEEGPAGPPATPEERRAKAREVYGKYAHTHTSVDAFLARKREEIDLEEERYRQRHPEAA